MSTGTGMTIALYDKDGNPIASEKRGNIYFLQVTDPLLIQVIETLTAEVKKMRVAVQLQSGQLPTE